MPRQIFERFDRASILSMLSESARTWLRDLQIHQELDSTNSHLLRNAEHGIDGVVCLAEAQYAGRGRRGRTWLAIPGRGIAMSIGRQVRLPVADLAPISLVVGLAVAEALDRSGIERVTLKWPNDVLIGGAKAAGILVEVAGAAMPQVVIGVGLNLGATETIAARLGSEVGDAATNHEGLSRNAIVARLIDCIIEFTQRFESVGFEPYRAAWERMHAYQNCVADVHVGADVVTGILLGVTTRGELRVEIDGVVRMFNSGEVSLRAHE